MRRQIDPRRTRWKFALILCFAAGTFTGCESYPSSRAFSDDDSPLTVASIDAGAGGLKVTMAELLPAAGGSKLQGYSTSNLRSQTFVSLADAAWQWERKTPPQLVVIGEEWVRVHGFPASWAKQLGTLGLQQGRRPLVAVTAGNAEEFVRNAPTAREGIALLRKANWSSDPLPMRTFRYEDDLILPYLPWHDWTGPRKNVSAHAVLFKKGQLAGLLSPQQTTLLTCLRGDSSLPELTWPMTAAPGSFRLEQASCHTEVRGNGNLLHPAVTVRLRIQGTPQPDAGTIKRLDNAELALQASLAGLVRYLQERRTDPLRWGESFRVQYAGIWSPDRWRTAFAGADVKLIIHVIPNGGTNS